MSPIRAATKIDDNSGTAGQINSRAAPLEWATQITVGWWVGSSGWIEGEGAGGEERMRMDSAQSVCTSAYMHDISTMAGPFRLIPTPMRRATSETVVWAVGWDG